MRMWKYTLVFIIPIAICGCYGRYPQEKLGITIGIGYDINKAPTIQYIDTIETILVSPNKEIKHETVSGKANTIYTTQYENQAKYSKHWILGTEMAYVVGEERARSGIKDLMDAFMKDYLRKQTAVIVVSKEPAKDILNLNPTTTTTIAEYIYDLSDFMYIENFFPRKIILPDLLTMYYQEGRNIVLPYVKISEKNVELSGLALFKEDKLIRTTSLEEARLINLLRNKNSKGTIGVNSTDTNEYFDFNCLHKLKVKVSKENDHLKYDIFVNLSGDIKLDTMHKGSLSSNVSDVEKQVSEKVEKDLKREVEIMQNVYGVDWLDIGKYAVAKYGRTSGYGSDEAFRNAKIDVHVKTKVNITSQSEK